MSESVSGHSQKTHVILISAFEVDTALDQRTSKATHGDGDAEDNSILKEIMLTFCEFCIRSLGSSAY